jgi:EAL domain-containing protein (putative c-di-GMP-specific phosphodiesterase class I)/GGDEF domain-containing protein
LLRQPALLTNTSLGTLPRSLLVAVVALACCLLAELLTLGSFAGLVIWPGAAVALAAGWRFGVRWVLPAAFGAALWALLRQESLPLALAAFAASSAGPAIAITAIRRLSAWKPADHRLEAVFRFVVAASLLAAPIDALIATLGSAVAADASGAGLLETFAAWWLIDALGMVLLAPALLACCEDGVAEPEPGAADTLAIDPGALLMTIGTAAGSVALHLLGAGPYASALLFFYFPIVAWTAVRLSERTAALTLLATALPLLAVRSWQGHAGGAGLPLEGSLLVLCAVLVGLLMQAVAADRRFALARVAEQARQDLTTGLLNDRGLLAELGSRLVAPDRPNYGLVGVHIGNFDTIHDLCGPIQALQLEQSAAMLLTRQAGGLRAARLSSGRFALLVPADTVAQVRSLARDIYAQLNGQVYKAVHGSIRLQASVGGLLLDRHVLIDAEDCLLSLSDAMAIAASVRDPQLFVEPLSQTMIDARRSHQGKIEHIREAIREERLEVHAQPIVDPEAPDGMLSFEILTRLRDRDGTMIRPPEFLPLAVQAQMTVELDRGVIRKVFGWLAANPAALARTHKCSINLSGLTMSDGSIPAFIREQRTLHGIPAEKVVFEITESEAIRNPGAASRLVDDLKADGFGIALDDFGTGLATFEYLKRFPLDYLKIDGSFIRNLVSNPIDEEIVLSTVRVARRLKVRTIAEHVHNQEIYDRLRLLGVEYVQGELIGTPVPLEALFAEDRKWERTGEAAQRRLHAGV